MKLEKIIAFLESDVCVNNDNADVHRKEGNLPMAYYHEGIADGMTLALRYLEQLDKKETAAPASTAANPL